MTIDEILEQLAALEVGAATTSGVEVRTVSGESFTVHTVAYQNGNVVLFVADGMPEPGRG